MKMNEILKQIKELRKNLLDMIDQMPDAQTGVNQISKKPAIAIVKFSHIQKNKGILSPRYYLNCEAKEALKNMIKLTKIEDLPERIDEIIRSGVIIVNKDRIKLNPEFVTFLKNMWEGALDD